MKRPWKDIWDFDNPEYSAARFFYITSIGFIVLGGLALLMVSFT